MLPVAANFFWSKYIFRVFSLIFAIFVLPRFLYFPGNDINCNMYKNALWMWKIVKKKLEKLSGNFSEKEFKTNQILLDYVGKFFISDYH